MECPKNIEWGLIILLLALAPPCSARGSAPIRSPSFGSHPQDMRQLFRGEDIYRRISPGGTHVYSDRPGAPPPALPPNLPGPRSSSLHIYITEPPAGSSMVSPVGSIKLGYRLSSPPPSGSRIRVLVDGRPAKGYRSGWDEPTAVNGAPHFRAEKDGALLLEGLAPGSRWVQLQLFSGKGTLLGESEPAIYYFLLPPR